MSDLEQLYNNMDKIMNTDEFSKEYRNQQLEKNKKISDHSHTKSNQSFKNEKKSKKTYSKPNQFDEKYWKFDTDYNDHFETPLVAYIDIYNTIVEIAKILKKPLRDLVIYDPYYCKGSTSILINRVFQMILPNENITIKVINENRDFYQDIKKNKVPQYDILITNPPYSGDHKSKLLNYIASTKEHSENNLMKPFLLLLPLYTCTKSYWKEFVQNHSSMSTYYILPPDHYCYIHPDGTGKDLPPFYSSWLVGVHHPHDSSMITTAIRNSVIKQSHIDVSSNSNQDLRRMCKCYHHLSELIRDGFVQEKRSNPKQRKKLKMKLGIGTDVGTSIEGTKENFSKNNKANGAPIGSDAAQTQSDGPPKKKKKRY